MLEQDLIEFLKSRLSFGENQVFYQHLERRPQSPFAWLVRNGDEFADAMDDDDGDEPFVVYFDLEIYSSFANEIQQKSGLARRIRNYGGAMGQGTVQDLEISDQRDDYETQATAETLPAYGAYFRVAVRGYQAGS